MAAMRATMSATVSPIVFRADARVSRTVNARPLAAAKGLLKQQKIERMVARSQTQLTPRPDIVDDDEEEESLRDKGGFLKYFPPLTNLESYAEMMDQGGNTKKVLVFAAGGAAEQLLLFPLLKQIRSRLPNAQIDVMCSEWAHFAYDVCPYVNKTWIYNVDGFSLPSDYIETVGMIKNEYYSSVVSASPLGFNSASLLWMASTTNMMGYVKSGTPGDTVAAWMMAKAVDSPAEDPLCLGTSAFDALSAALAVEMDAPAPASPAQIGIPEYPQKFAIAACEQLGLAPERFILAHGVPTSSLAAMQMTRFPQSASTSLETFKSVSQSCPLPMVITVPREQEAEEVAAACPGVKVLVVPSPAKLAAMIALSGGVVAANTGALPLASYLNKKALGIFESEEVASKFSYSSVVSTTADAAPSLVRTAL